MIFTNPFALISFNLPYACGTILYEKFKNLNTDQHWIINGIAWGTISMTPGLNYFNVSENVSSGSVAYFSAIGMALYAGVGKHEKLKKISYIALNVLNFSMNIMSAANTEETANKVISSVFALANFGMISYKIKDLAPSHFEYEQVSETPFTESENI